MGYLTIIKENLTIGLFSSLAFLLLSELWHYIRKERVSLLHRMMILCLGVYLTDIFTLTVSPVTGWSISYFGNNINLIPFQVLKTLGNNPLNFFGNIIMFFPFGLLLVLLSERCIKPYVTITAGVMLSAGIEFFQLFSLRATDIDDIILNTAGTLLGFLSGRILLILFPALRRNVGTYMKSGKEYYKKVNDAGIIAMLSIFTLALVLFNGFTKYTAVLKASDNVSAEEIIAISKPEVNLLISPEVEAKNVYVLNVDSDSVVYEKNGDKKIAPASTTKMLTALTVLDYCNLEDVVTVGTEVQMIAEDASRAWLCAGNKLTVRQLLVALLLPSGNDAAYALAVHTGRTIRNDHSLSAEQAIQIFMDAMNEEAESIGAVSSHFTSPDGYDKKGQYTTAHDLACIAKAFINNHELYEIVGSPKISDTWISGEMVTYDNTNELINPDSEYYNQNITGLKTGRSSEAGSCLVSSADIQSETYICVVMGSSETGRWVDSLNIYASIR